MKTLEKVKRLQKYVGFAQATVDPMMESTIDKLLARETSRQEALRGRLATQLHEFESHYGYQSAEFYARYERGEMGDQLDFMEWAATVEMLADNDD